MSERIEKLENLIGEGVFNKEVATCLLNMLKDMDNEIETLTSRCTELEEEIEAINEDINLLNDGMHIEEYDTVFSAVCPYCQEEIEINIEDLENEEDFTCPHCKKEISLEWDDECGCGCDCDHECDDDCDCGEHDKE